MLTIYEKETLIESLDETFTEIKAYVEGAIGQEALHDVEQHLFRRLQSLGRGLMETFVALSGSAMKRATPRFQKRDSPWPVRGRRRKVRPICPSLEKSLSTGPPMPIPTGVGSIPSMQR